MSGIRNTTRSAKALKMNAKATGNKLKVNDLASAHIASPINEFENNQIEELMEMDDWGSSWKECKELGLKWGGRGMGGRATGRNTVQAQDVVVEGCTMAYGGTNLLERTTLRLLHGHAYGLIGRNGVGKSTLMRRIASGTLPGFPPHLKVAQVHQELPSCLQGAVVSPTLLHPSSPDDPITSDTSGDVSDGVPKAARDMSPVEYVVHYNPVRRLLLWKIAQLESGFESDDDEDDNDYNNNSSNTDNNDDDDDGDDGVSGESGEEGGREGVNSGPKEPKKSGKDEGKGKRGAKGGKVKGKGKKQQIDVGVENNREKRERREKREKKVRDPEELASMLEELYDLLEDEGQATPRAVRILRGLGFTEKRMRAAKMKELSGGWRMRAAIGCALAQEPDILLLDEPTNHLDLEGVEWLISYLNSVTTHNPAAAAAAAAAGGLSVSKAQNQDSLSESSHQTLTVLVTSHDSTFLDSVCSDIVRFHKQQLHYYVGNFSDYEALRREKELSSARTQESVDRQRKHIEESLKKLQQQAAKDNGGKGGGQQGMISSRKKKLARHGAEKNIHGHKFNAQHEATAGRASTRAGSQCETAMGYKSGVSRSLVEAAEKEWKMVLPDPTPLGTHTPILQMRDVTVGFRTPQPVVGEERRVEEGGGGERRGEMDSSGEKKAQKVTKVLSLSAGKQHQQQLQALKDLEQQQHNAELVRRRLRADPALRVVVENVIFAVEEKQKVAIVGKNGSGKSTLMNLIAGNEQSADILPLSPHSAVTPPATTAAATTTTAYNSPVLLAGEVRRHPTAKVAYYQQHLAESLPYHLSPLEHLTFLTHPELAMPQPPIIENISHVLAVEKGESGEQEEKGVGRRKKRGGDDRNTTQVEGIEGEKEGALPESTLPSELNNLGICAPAPPTGSVAAVTGIATASAAAVDVEALEKSGAEFNEQALRAHLGSFGLSGPLALQPIGLLSGGQKARVLLAEITLFRPHLLLLDEPTNNLDLDSIRALRDALKAYTGACIITSHDTAFVEGTADIVYHLAPSPSLSATGGLQRGAHDSSGAIRSNSQQQQQQQGGGKVARLVRLEGGVNEYRQFVKATVRKQLRTQLA